MRSHRPSLRGRARKARRVRRSGLRWSSRLKSRTKLTVLTWARSMGRVRPVRSRRSRARGRGWRRRKLAGGIAGRSCVDVSSGAEAVALHGGKDADLGGEGEEEHDDAEDGLDLVVFAKRAGGAAEQEGCDDEDDAADEADDVQVGDGVADDDAGFVGGGEVGEGDGREDEGEEGDATDPEDDGVEPEGAEQGGHGLYDDIF